jgi:phosphosulfolactate synthase
MLNYEIPYLPERPHKPRQHGLTMMMDKGLSIREAENFVSACSEYTDLVKLGFGTGLISPNLQEKIKLYKKADLKPYFGGTMFEAFIIRNMFDEYRKMLDKYRVEVTEVSDGSMVMPHDEKLKYISLLSQQATVLSEVGSKVADVVITADRWVAMMKAELQAGSWKVIAEARESGTVGIYKKDGTANTDLVDDIVGHIKPEDVLWEAPDKKQQVWFIKLLGPNVNLGNIAAQEVIPLETLRLGLRGDTFFDSLPDQFQDRKQ